MFEILEHTADIGFRACAPSLSELFCESARALQAIVLEEIEMPGAAEYRLLAEGADRESLLVNFLNEVLFQLDARRVVFARFEPVSMRGTRITVRAWGEPRDPERHRAKAIVKGVTYHQLRVWQEADRWCAEVYLDI